MTAIRRSGAAAGSLHLGVTPWREDWDGSAASLVEQGRWAEALGYDSFWLPESHFTGRSAIPAPLLRLAALAAHTTRLRLATTSYLLPVRHPLHAAAEVAELDRLSGGRVILGVGRGFRPALFRAFGVPVREKRDRFEAALATMQAAWRGEPIRSAGDADDSEPVILAPLPVQKPHPPIWVAGFGPKAVAQAGRLGLPYLASPIETLDALVSNYARHREAYVEAGHTGELPVPVMRTVFASRDAALVERVRTALARQAAALASQRLASMQEHAAAPVGDWALLGSPAEVEDGVAHYREKLGVTHLIIRSHVPAAEPADVSRSLEWLASSLRPGA